MAQMFPASLYEADARNPEVKVYDALRDQLDDSWDVFHHASWTVRRGEKGSWDGEIDFVVSHPDHGFLCIEVKGGALRFTDGGRSQRKQKGEWVPYDPDPFDQAVGHTHDLRRLIRQIPGWRDRRPLVGQGVAFPNIPIGPVRLPPRAPRQLIIDRNDVRDIEAAIRRVFAFHAGDRNEPPGDRGRRMLRERLAPEVEIEVPLAERFLEEEQEPIRLTHDQSMLLRRFGLNRRMAVSGCAGSGKTMLAVEQAKWLKREKGLYVGYMCFNRKLADFLKEREGGAGVDFTTFHSLCIRLAREAPGVRLPRFPDDDDPAAHEFWTNEVPELLVDATNELGGIYDALMIDEAQDLHSHWLTALMTTVRDERDAFVWLFMDSNQEVYEARLEVPADFMRYSLTVNCRNTQAVHREVMKKYRGEVTPEAMGPEGTPVDLIQTDDQAAAVAGVISRLCDREDVPPQDIVVLSSHGFGKSHVASALPGKYRLVDQRDAAGHRVFLSSIRGFKGLESKAVILCELEDIEDESLDAQIYVGMSRARNYCVVVAPKP